MKSSLRPVRSPLLPWLSHGRLNQGFALSFGTVELLLSGKGPVGQKELHHIGIVGMGGKPEGGGAILVGFVWVCPVGQKDLRYD